MKTRKGFVSNSSTTSFMVCFKPEPKDLSFKTFEFILKRITNTAHSSQLEIFRDTVKNRKEDLLKEQKVLLKDEKFLKEKLAKISKYRFDTKLMQKLDEIETICDDLDSVRHARISNIG